MVIFNAFHTQNIRRSTNCWHLSKWEWDCWLGIRWNLVSFVFSFLYFYLPEVLQEVDKLFWKNKWFSVSAHPKFELSMVEEVTKIDMQELACICFKHKVAWMSVSDTKHICGNALSCQWPQIPVMVVVYLFSYLLGIVCTSELFLLGKLIHEEFHYAILFIWT